MYPVLQVGKQARGVGSSGYRVPPRLGVPHHPCSCRGGFQAFQRQALGEFYLPTLV